MGVLSPTVQVLWMASSYPIRCGSIVQQIGGACSLRHAHVRRMSRQNWAIVLPLLPPPLLLVLPVLPPPPLLLPTACCLHC